MPQAVYAWVWAFTYAAGATAAAATAIAVVGTGLFVAGVSLGLAKVSAALQGRPKLGSDMQSRKVTARSSTEYRTILYGSGRTGGILCHINTSGTSNEWLDFVIVIAGHQITAITDVWFDDVKIPNADINSGNAAGGAVGGSGKYRPRDGLPVAYVYKYLGTDTQAASSTLDAAYSEWTSDHRLRSCAYVHIRLRRHQDVYDTGPPANFTFGFQGAKVYDPRKDSTNGGTGSHRIADPSTWEYTDNWALCVADYLIGGSLTNSSTRVNWRGFGADPDDVVWSTVIAAANVADEDVDIPHPNEGDPETQKRYTCGGALSTGNWPADNLEQLLTAGLGQCVYSSNGYRLYAGAYQTPTLTLDEDDLAGDVSLISQTPRAERYNAVRGTRWDVTTGQEVEFLPRTSPTYEAQDGGQIFREIELPFTQNEYRAQRLAQIILRRSREQETLTMHCQPAALRVGVWETVAVSLDEFELDGKVYRCLERQEHEDQSVTLTLREEFAATYTDPSEEDYGDLTPAEPEDPGKGVTPLPPTNIRAQSVVDGILFTWQAAVTNPPNVRYRIYEYTSATPFSSATLVADGIVGTSRTLTRSAAGTRYYWLTAVFGDEESTNAPATNGIPGAPLSVSEGFRLDGSRSVVYWGDTDEDSTSTISVTVTAVNGTAPFTYAWTRESGSTKLAADSSSSATTTFTATGVDEEEVAEAVFRCTATDSASPQETATWDVNVSYYRFTLD